MFCATLFAFVYHGAEVTRRAAVPMDKILKGANPSEIPVEQPTNLKC